MMAEFFQNKRNSRKWKRIWRYVKPVATVVLSLVIVYAVARVSVGYVLSHYLEPVDRNDATPIEVVIPPSSSAGTIARILYNARGVDEPGLIQNTAVFKVYVDFVGKASSLQAGTYILSRNMSVKQIVNIICAGNPPRQTVSFTITEGNTIPVMAQQLVDKGILTDAFQFLQAMELKDSYAGFTFLPKGGDGREYVLEGYLFPDTYEVYTDTTAEAIAVKMLNRFNEIWTDEYTQRAAELGMTMDEVVSLASLIQTEAQVTEDFAKVSAVFHNRLKKGMKLESCASLCYVLKERKYTFTAAELATESPYNTYLNAGLPVGPVCNPGKLALEAALWPNEEYLEGAYLYFSNGKIINTNKDGTVTYDYSLVFDKTYEEHQAHVAENRAYWPQ